LNDAVAVCVAAAALALIASAVRRVEPGTGRLLSAALSLWIVFLIVRGAAYLKNGMTVALPDKVGQLLPYVFRCAGIGLVSQTAADICTDSGEVSAGSRIRVAGKLGMLTVCLPLIKNILDTALGLING